MIDTKKTLDLLNKLYQDDPDQLGLLKEAIDNEEFFIDDEGNTNMSSEYVRKSMELKYRRMSPEEMYVSIKISIINCINYHLDLEVDIQDEIVEKLANQIVDHVRRAIVTEATIDYWNNVK